MDDNMPNVNIEINQETLDSLRIIRRKLYSIPESELNAMSLEDQTKYADNLHKVSLAILKLEAAKLKGVNNAFKRQEKKLKAAAADLEEDAEKFAEAVKMIRAVGDGLEMVTNVVGLLA